MLSRIVNHGSGINPLPECGRLAGNERRSWRTGCFARTPHYAGQRSQGAQEGHGLAAHRTTHGLRSGIRWAELCNGLRWVRWERAILLEMLFQERKLSAAVGSEETEVTDLHETFGQHMLKEALEETFNRESAVFELPGIGSAILKGNLRSLQASIYYPQVEWVH